MYQENEYVIVCASVHCYGKLDVGLTSVLLRSVELAKMSKRYCTLP